MEPSELFTATAMPGGDGKSSAMGGFFAVIFWLVVFRPTPLKNDGVKVSWDDDIPNIWKYGKIIQMFQTN